MTLSVALARRFNEWPLWLIFTVIVTLSTINDGLIAGISAELAFDRRGIASGEWWRLVSCHWVHLNWNHTWLNAGGLLILIFGFQGEVRVWQQLVILAACVVTTSLGIFWFSPEIGRYYGFSGVAWGYLVAVMVLTLPRAWGFQGLALLVILGYLVWSVMNHQTLMSSAEMIGGQVAVDSHIYGAIGGLLAGVALLYHQQTRHKVEVPS